MLLSHPDAPTAFHCITVLPLFPGLPMLSGHHSAPRDPDAPCASQCTPVLLVLPLFPRLPGVLMLPVNHRSPLGFLMLPSHSSSPSAPSSSQPFTLVPRAVPRDAGTGSELCLHIPRVLPCHPAGSGWIQAVQADPEVQLWMGFSLLLELQQLPTLLVAALHSEEVRGARNTPSQGSVTSCIPMGGGVSSARRPTHRDSPFHAFMCGIGWQLPHGGV